MRIMVKSATNHVCLVSCDMIDYNPNRDRITVGVLNHHGVAISIMSIKRGRMVGHDDEDGTVASVRITTALAANDYCEISCESYETNFV